MIMYIIHICFRRPHPNTLPRAQYQNHFGGKKKCTQSGIKSLYGHGIKSLLAVTLFPKGMMYLSISNSLIIHEETQRKSTPRRSLDM